MAINLVSSVMQSLTPDMIVKIASMFGLDRNMVQKVIGAGVPAILASFAGLASSPNGAGRLSSALAQQSGALDQLKASLGGTGQQALAESGSGMLSTLLGGGALNTITTAVSNYAGVDTGTSKSLLGLLGPVVAGALGQQQRNAGLSASGVANLLNSQQDQIKAAMPSEFANLLSGSGLLGAGDTLRRGAEAAAGGLSGMPSQAMHAVAAQRAPSSSWPYWLAGLAALFGLAAWYFGSIDNPKLADRLPASTETVGKGTTISVADLTNELTSSMTTVRTTLQGITDPASAQAALPKLQQATAQFDRINKFTEQLPPAAKQGLASSVAASMPALNQLCDRILATPGVAAVAKPAIDALRTKIEALSQA